MNIDDPMILWSAQLNEKMRRSPYLYARKRKKVKASATYVK